MGGIFTPPTFTAPPQPPIVVGSVGQVLTVTAPNVVAFAAGGSGTTGYLGTYLAPTALVSATVNDYNPATFGVGVGRVDVTPASGGTTLTGWIAGGDGQIVLVTNISATDFLTLANQNAGSSAINRFRGSGDISLPPFGRCWMVYYGGSVNRWSTG